MGMAPRGVTVTWGSLHTSSITMPPSSTSSFLSTQDGRRVVDRLGWGVGEWSCMMLGLAVTTSSHARSEGVEMFTLTWPSSCW